MKHIDDKCKHHNYPYIFQCLRGEKCLCYSCIQSKRDQELCSKINKEHIKGQKCKAWTQCEKCSTQRYFSDLLKHLCEICRKNCQFCNCDTKPYRSLDTKQVVKNIYRHNLGKWMI